MLYHSCLLCYVLELKSLTYEISTHEMTTNLNVTFLQNWSPIWNPLCDLSLSLHLSLQCVNWVSLVMPILNSHWIRRLVIYKDKGVINVSLWFHCRKQAMNRKITLKRKSNVNVRTDKMRFIPACEQKPFNISKK